MKNLKNNLYNMFSVSKPWGYYPDEVEDKVRALEEEISDLKNKLKLKQDIEAKKDIRIEHLENELKSLHIEMSALELPDTAELMQKQILSEFKDFKSDGSTPKDQKKKHPKISEIISMKQKSTSTDNKVTNDQAVSDKAKEPEKKDKPSISIKISKNKTNISQMIDDYISE